MSESGKPPPSSFATATEELASIADASAANCCHVAGCRARRPFAASLRRQHYPRKPPPRAATVDSEMGHKQKPHAIEAVNRRRPTSESSGSSRVYSERREKRFHRLLVL